MQDEPKGAEILEVVAKFLRETIMPKLSGDTAFYTRVAANAVDLVRREIEHASDAHAAEHARLVALLGEEGSLEALNWRLCARIADGSMTADNPDLREHLWLTTLDKLAVDQPSYSGYRRARSDEE